MRIPFIVAADWNMRPEQLRSTGWVNEVEGAIIALPLDETCSCGGGPVLDYLVVSPECAEIIMSIEPDFDGAWRPHAGYRVHIRGKPCKYKVARLMLPRKLDLLGIDKEAVEHAWQNQDDKKVKQLKGMPEDAGEWVARRGAQNQAVASRVELANCSKKLERTYEQATDQKGARGRADIPVLKEIELRAVTKDSDRGVFRSREVDLWARACARLAEYQNLYKEKDSMQRASVAAKICQLAKESRKSDDDANNDGYIQARGEKVIKTVVIARMVLIDRVAEKLVGVMLDDARTKMCHDDAEGGVQD
jgi:hypothetical protein